MAPEASAASLTGGFDENTFVVKAQSAEDCVLV
jgi:hypothetical protein